jgi:hypothetical protein
MAGRESGDAWHSTTVILQSDIYKQALGQGIDISDACNRALAGLTGVAYNGPERPAPPVIIAREGAVPQAHAGAKKTTAVKPVINADDPAAPAAVIRAKAAKKAPAEHPAPAPAAARPGEDPAAAPAAAPKRSAGNKERGGAPRKRGKGDALKTFFSSRIARTDDPESILGKDELYELFARFCREHRLTPVPERKAVTTALKNRFALMERVVNGTPSWTGIRLK